jgi:hypothetical protein
MTDEWAAIGTHDLAAGNPALELNDAHAYVLLWVPSLG